MKSKLGIIEDQLLPNEKVLFKTKRHWFYIANPFTLFIVPIIIPDLIIGWFIRLLAWKRNYTVITDRRILTTKGILSPDTQEFRLSKIASLKLDQSLFGRLFNYGTIRIRTVGGEEFVYKKQKNAKTYRQIYNEAVDKLENNNSY